jgi:hypothetical protein
MSALSRNTTTRTENYLQNWPSKFRNKKKRQQNKKQKFKQKREQKENKNNKWESATAPPPLAKQSKRTCSQWAKPSSLISTTHRQNISGNRFNPSVTKGMSLVVLAQVVHTNATVAAQVLHASSR